jgi:hypothetical protein
MSSWGNETREFQRIAHCTLIHASHADSDANTHELQIKILDHLNEKMCSLASPDWTFYSLLRANEVRGEVAFIVLLTIFGHTGYVRRRLEKDNRILPNNSTASFLLCKLLEDGWGPRKLATVPLLELKIVALLLSFGADPNCHWQANRHSQSSWEHLMILMKDPQLQEHRRYLQIIKLLVSSGANIDRGASPIR